MMILKISLVFSLLSIQIISFSDASSLSSVNNLNSKGSRYYYYGSYGCDPRFYEYTGNINYILYCFILHIFLYI